MGTQEDIQQRINNRLTINANLVEGGFSQDIIGSVSYELANIYDTEINNILDKCFVETATGDYLDLVAADYGMTRRESTQATVYLTITGTPGAVVNSSIKAVYNNLIFTVQEQKQIGAGGSVSVKAKCESYGTIGNVAANTITEFLTVYAGLSSVNNPQAGYDGFDRESDDDFRARIKLYLSEDAVNCNEAQYKQWALEVAGVKKAVIKDASVVGAGNVGVYIASTTGTVSQDLINTVKAYIEEKQFINATLIVSALTNIAINTTATITLKTGYTVDDVEQEYNSVLTEYLDTTTNLVSYFRASDILFACSGVDDVLSFELNNDEASIPLTDTQIAVLGVTTIGT